MQVIHSRKEKGPEELISSPGAFLMEFLYAFSAKGSAEYGLLFSDHTSDRYDRLAVSASVVRYAPGAALGFNNISVSVIERNVA